MICNGVPSQKLWKKFVNHIEEKNGGKISYVTFKNKRNGWENPSAFGLIGNKEVSLKGYTEWFYGQYSLRESCYACPYTQIDRMSDITIGDYWGVRDHYPDFYDSNGVSLALVHTEKGNELIDAVRESISCIEIKKEDCLQPRLLEPAPRPVEREKFWSDIENKDIEYCEKNYKENNGETIINRLKRIIKKVFK